VIDAVHTIVFAQDAQAARAFFRDVLDFPYVDAGDGWLIFGLPPGELGVHPSAETVTRHELYLMCTDDIDQTVRELTARGVQFTSPVTDQGFGRVVHLRVPGAGEMALYQPRHPTAYELPG